GRSPTALADGRGVQITGFLLSVRRPTAPGIEEPLTMVVLDLFYPWSAVLNLRTSPYFRRKNPAFWYGALRGQNASGGAWRRRRSTGRTAPGQLALTAPSE